MARLTLLCGLPGAGKTALARRIERSRGAWRLSPDEWLVALGLGLHDEGARERVEALQWRLALDLLGRGQDVVLENGFWSRAEREERRAAARAAGAQVELCLVDAPLEELWRRLERRNRGADDVSAAVVTRGELEGWAALFERPDAAEMARFDPPQVP